MNKLLDRARTGVVIAAALAVCDCNLVLGTEDWTYERGAGGSGGAATLGGASDGGSGLGPAELHAADWTTSFDAVYQFEKGPPSLGEDATGNGHDLEVLGAPALDTESFQEGERSVVLDGAQNNGFKSLDPVFASPPGTVMTFGGWFRVDEDTEPPAFLRHDNRNGYSVSRDDGLVNCLAEREAPYHFATVFSEAPWEVGVWIHVVCRLDADLRMTTLANGSVSGVGTKVDIGDDVSDASVQIGAGEYTGSPIEFLGRADEIFFVRSALSNASIKRIWACGITGRGCTCDVANPSSYLDCGRAAGSCTSLPACDAPLE
ncbi:MAG: hypothetical protein JNK04_05390 [Myxococcales bacterium]|nr:hypothetical protein [Myxococcales bacterium]